jgi:hypothetical protein
MCRFYKRQAEAGLSFKGKGERRCPHMGPIKKNARRKKEIRGRRAQFLLTHLASFKHLTRPQMERLYEVFGMEHSSAGVAAIVNRLEDQGLVEALPGLRAYDYVLTKRGMKAAGLTGYNKVEQIPWGALEHDAGIFDAYIRLIREYGIRTAILTEVDIEAHGREGGLNRRLTHSKHLNQFAMKYSMRAEGSQKTATPDLLMFNEERPTAIEVELSFKSKEAYRRIIAAYDMAVEVGGFKGVVYMTPSDNPHVGNRLRKTFTKVIDDYAYRVPVSVESPEDFVSLRTQSLKKARAA